MEHLSHLVSEPLFQRQGGEVLFAVSHPDVDSLDDCETTAISGNRRYASAAAGVRSALQRKCAGEEEGRTRSQAYQRTSSSKEWNNRVVSVKR